MNALTIMAPEEILLHAQRVLLFPEKNSKARKTYYVQGNTLVREMVYYYDGLRHTVLTDPKSIRDLYDQIELVYSQKNKGVLLARCQGNRDSNQKRLLPLKKTGKGMGAMVQKNVNPMGVYKEMAAMESEINKRGKARYYKERKTV